MAQRQPLNRPVPHQPLRVGLCVARAAIKQLYVPPPSAELMPQPHHSGYRSTSQPTTASWPARPPQRGILCSSRRQASTLVRRPLRPLQSLTLPQTLLPCRASLRSSRPARHPSRRSIRAVRRAPRRAPSPPQAQVQAQPSLLLLSLPLYYYSKPLDGAIM